MTILSSTIQSRSSVIVRRRSASLESAPAFGSAAAMTAIMPESRYTRPVKNGGGKRSLAQDVSMREAWAWSMYDFANSGYTTVVITAVFNAYFVSAVAGKASWATFAWTAALSASYAAILVTGPLIGAWAAEDAS